MRPRYRPIAFTIIELLVVISIIALLISILLPALGTARETAKQLVCLTRARSVNHALALYHADHKDFYPYGHDKSPPGTNDEGDYTYYQELLTYLGLQRVNHNRVDADHEILHDPVIWEQWAGPASSTAKAKRFGVFTYNPHMMGWLSNAGAYDPSGLFSLFTSGNRNVNISDIDAIFAAGQGPSSTVILMDGFSPDASPTTNNTILNSNQAVFSAPHLEAFNPRNYQAGGGAGTQSGTVTATGGATTATFMDGHARTVAPREFPGGSGLASWRVAP